MKVNAELVIGNNKYRIHDDYPMFGVDLNGNVINIITRESVNVNPDKKTIRLRGLVGKSRNIKINQYVWEAYNGTKPKGKAIGYINNDNTDNRLENLELYYNTNKKRFTAEERQKNDEACRARWMKKEWVCPNCGKVTNNNASGYHKKVCTADNPHKCVNKRKLKDGEVYWKNKMFKCRICNREYKNSYRYLHNILCEKKNECVRQRSH